MRRKRPVVGETTPKSSYQELEHGSVRKKWKNRLPVALIYPNTYRVGMSNLGFQLVYSLLNHHPDIVAERIFLPENDDQPRSIESGRPLRDFPILFCSVSFEHDYLNLLQLFTLGAIPPLAADRARLAADTPVAAGNGMPLIIGGGVATFINPEPLAPFIDLFVIGEAEPVLPRLLDYLTGHSEKLTRQELLLKIAGRFVGCYVPAFYHVTYNSDGTLTAITPEHGIPRRVQRLSLPIKGATAAHSQILTPEAEFADLYMTELGRGCSRGCRFCAAGFVYRPPRLWPVEEIINSLALKPAVSRRVGLLGMEMARPEDLATIAGHLLHDSCLLSFSSLRADVITPPLLELLAKSKLKSAAIAPDGGSQRLRQVINKGISEEEVLSAAESLVRAGIRNLKLYFMIGLPTETQDDMEELVALTLKAKRQILDFGRSAGRLSTLTLSINCFIPKPWTPFQFHPFESQAILKARLRYLRGQLAGLPNVKISADHPDKAFFQAVLARGDRRLGNGLLAMVKTGRNWRQSMKDQHLRPEHYALRARDQDELLPWEIIDHGISRDYLWAEYQKGLTSKATRPCNTAKCRTCGVCNG